MLNAESVQKWAAGFVEAMRAEFGDRLVYVGQHGSWARGEARPDSDIDLSFILDVVEPQDLQRCRSVIEGMPDAEKIASGVLLSVEELKKWNPGERVQFFFGRKVLYGSVDSLVQPPTPEQLIADIRRKASDNLLAARHYMMYPHDRSRAVHRLKYPFKYCFYALQAWMLAKTGRFIERKAELLEALSDPLDKQVIEVVRDWHKLEADRTARPEYYMQMLERWSSRMLARLPEV